MLKALFVIASEKGGHNVFKSSRRMRNFLLVLSLLLSGTTAARILNGYCDNTSEKCGFLDFGFLMHQGQTGSLSCVEICAFVPLVRFGFECGSCSNVPSSPSGTTLPSTQQIITSAPSPAPLCSTDRCVFGLGFAMRQGAQDTTACVEICTFNPVLRDGFACGYCNSDGSLPPSPKPTTLSPTSSPTKAPTEHPTISNKPSMIPTITAMPVDSVGFDIQLSFSDGMEDGDKDLFVNAVNRWESVVVGDLPDVQRSDIDEVAPDGCEYPRKIDDLLICAFLGPIDGPGTVVGIARPLFIRGTDDDLGLPVTGEILFDTDDLASIRNAGLLQDLITHEMGHVLGFGLLWADLGQAEPSTSQFCPYFGPLATAEFNQISGCSGTTTPIELEDTDVGTRCLHWAENCLENELMTGVLEFDAMPLSRITVASFEDIGYSVSYDNADPFGEEDLNPECVCRRRQMLTKGDAILLTDDASHASRQRRRLNDELRQKAIVYGLSVLESSAVKYTEASMTRETEKQKITFVGDRAVSVLVRDGDSFFGVLVTREMASK